MERPCPKGTRGKQGSLSPQGRVLACCFQYDLRCPERTSQSLFDLSDILAYKNLFICKERQFKYMLRECVKTVYNGLRL